MNTKVILLVDNDEDFRSSIKTLLRSQNYYVVEADSGEKGLQMLKAIKPNLIILELMMKSLDEGYVINHLIKYQKDYGEFKDIPIIMISSFQHDPLSRLPYAPGELDMIEHDFYITKPVNISKFFKLVNEALKN